MSSDNKTPEDEAYDNLIQELGLDLDLDTPIGKTGGSDVMEADLDDQADGIDDAFYKIRDIEARPEEPASDDDGGVELSAELVAELRSVLGGGTITEAVNEESDNEEGDVFVTSRPDPVEPLPLAEDSFKIEEGVAAFTEPDLNLQDVLDSAATYAPDISEDVEVPAEPALDEPEADISEFALPDFPNEDELEQELVADISDDIDFSSDSDGETDDVDSDDADGFDLGFDAGVVLREVLQGRKGQTDETPRFSVADLMEDADAPVEEAEAEEDVLSFDEDFSLEDVLNDSFDSEVETDADDLPNVMTDDEPPFDSGAESLLSEQDEALEREFEALDAIEDAPFTEVYEVTAQASVSKAPEPELPPMDTVDDDEEVEYSFGFGEDGGDRMVPRVSLHAFCQTGPVTQLMTTVQNDRRMANVSMEVHQGGSVAAFDYYADKSTPHLIVIETTGKPARILAELDQLAERCDENVKVIVIGQANDIRLYRELMHRGVSDYIVPPMEPVQVIRSVSALFVDPEQPFVGKSIAVTGVKGGVGASTIAHNLAWTMATRLQANTTLVDLDLNFGTTGLDFNEESQQTIADAILSPDRFDEAVLERLLTRATDHLSLFTAPATLDRTYDLDVETFEQVMGLVRQSVPFMVMDLPHIWSDWFKSAVVSADEIVVVAQPELASLRNGKNLIDFLKAARPNDAAPRLVVNNVGMPKRPEIPVKDFASAIGVEPELVMPFDPQLFGTAANNGQMITDVAPESKCSQGIDYLAGLLTGREIQQERSGSIINKLFKR
ncbi:MAG: pilus assembly protein CpaF [Hirschia sp.]|nr:pilus assembly protein CpaF [Hirschia sp.]MBF17051.1 pilus assembly protein CpaF [Hirschia sp.]